ncbi:MAG: endonuclease V [Candidatus Thermoplasmatota archaeon]|nr:endonuclease V [Candidatus Thermoplasmatota archaeon]
MHLASTDGLPDLWKETYDLVAQVPEGRVTTYGEVAKALGDVVSSRFVGLAMSMNEDIDRVPCRRVVQSDGYVGGYTGGGPEKKIQLLRKEGIRFSGLRVVDLDEILFSDFRTEYPLRELRRRQTDLKRHLVLSEFKKEIKSVAGIDVAYDGDHAYAALVKFDFESKEETARHVVEGKALFPYIPTYLAFREIPVIEPLLDLVDDETVLMYDGNGVLHPKGFGITSQIGVVFDVPTIGVAKRLLCGEMSSGSSKGVIKIVLSGRLAGHALYGGRSERPTFVSAGHRVSQDQAKAIAVRFLTHRVPEPTRVAHIVAESARRGTNHK